MARLHQKFAKIGNGGKAKAGTSVPVANSRVPAPSSRVAITSSRAPSDPPETRASRPREDQPIAVVPTSRSRREDTPSRDPSSSGPGAEPIRQKSSTQKAFITKFDDRLTSDAICLAFSGNVAMRDFFNRMEESSLAGLGDQKHKKCRVECRRESKGSRGEGEGCQEESIPG
ncbi:hypothetical protein TIFTF001_029904 [Ficus carica]|uniref:Uncharacterized protein n=1 Tax=Ficus carica TaxID=3494 RepID=A0AA88DSB5_FICCA|nr:hypothetical protein TIFTF001_029904 [Ficus carica]